MDGCYSQLYDLNKKNQLLNIYTDVGKGIAITLNYLFILFLALYV